jgi:RecA/RadA recombinase
MDKLINLLSEVNSKYPGGVMLASDLKNIEQPDVPSGIYELDYLLGGGFSRGCMYHIYGESGHGKSATMTQTIAFNHKTNPDFVAAVLNLEGNWGPKYVEFMEKVGVDMSRCIIVTDPSVETALNIGLSLVKSRKLDFLVIDSAAAMMSSTEVQKNMEDGAKTADRASMIERYCRKITAHLHPLRNPKTREVTPNPCAVVFLNQLRTGGIGGYRAFRQPASSDALRFFVRNQICCYSAPKDDAIHYHFISEVDKMVPFNDQTEHFRNKGKIGKRLHYEIEKSRSGDESAETSVDFYFKDLKYPAPSGFMGIGFDPLSSLISLATTFNFVQNAGAWYEFEGNKFQGIEKFTHALRMNEDMLEEITSKVEEKIYGRRFTENIPEEPTEDIEETQPEVRESDGEGSGDESGKSIRRGRPKKA